MQTAKPAPRTGGNATKKNAHDLIEAEKAFAVDLYRDRAAVNRKAQAVLLPGSPQITIRLGNDELEFARAKLKPKV